MKPPNGWFDYGRGEPFYKKAADDTEEHLMKKSCIVRVVPTGKDNLYHVMVKK